MAKSKGGKGGNTRYPQNKSSTSCNKYGGGRSNNTAKGGDNSSGGKGKKLLTQHFLIWQARATSRVCFIVLVTQ